jgi:WD40 repeat protein
VWIWEPASGLPARMLEGIEDAQNYAEWSPDGKRLAIGKAKQVEIWNLHSGELIQTIQTKGRTKMLHWDKDGNRMLTWSEFGTLILDMREGRAKVVFPLLSFPNVSAWSPDGTQIAVESTSDEVWLLKLGSQAPFRRLKHPPKPTALAWSPDGTLIAVGLDSGQIWLWNAADATRKEILDGHTNQVTAMDFSPDGSKLVSASWDHSLRIWDTTSWRSLKRLSGHTGGLLDTEWRASGDQIVSTGSDGTVRIWSVMSARSPETWLETSGWVWNVGWSGDGKFLVATSDKKLFVRDNYDKTVHDLGASVFQMVGGSLATSVPLLAISDRSGRVVIKNISSRETIKTIDLHEPLWNVALSPDGTLVAASTEKSGKIFVWSLPNGDLQGSIDVGTFITSMAFAPDSNLLAFAPLGSESVKVVDIEAHTLSLSLSPVSIQPKQHGGWRGALTEGAWQWVRTIMSLEFGISRCQIPHNCSKGTLGRLKVSLGTIRVIALPLPHWTVPFGCGRCQADNFSMSL